MNFFRSRSQQALQTKSVEQANYEKLHYDKHIDFFKTMISLAGTFSLALVSLGIWFTWSSREAAQNEFKNNMLEARNEFRMYMSESRADIKEMKDEARRSVVEAEGRVNFQIEYLQNQMQEQVPLIRDQAENLALSAVNRTINEEFESRNIRELIENTADDRLKNQAGEILDERIRQRTADLDEQSKALARLTIATDQIRSGERRWWLTLDSMMKYHRLPIIRNLASELMQQKTFDYTRVHTLSGPMASLNHQDLLRDLKKPSSNNLDTIIRSFIEVINDPEQDLNIISQVILHLNSFSDKDFKFFVFVSINNWYNLKYPNEKEVRNFFSFCLFIVRHFFSLDLCTGRNSAKARFIGSLKSQNRIR